MSVLRNRKIPNPLDMLNLGSGMDTGTGKRNIDLDKFKPTIPNPDYDVTLPADEQYDLDPGQKVEQYGNKYNVIGENAPGVGLLSGGSAWNRKTAGLLDFLTFGIGDFDQRGNLFGGEHLPGIMPGSGYGGTPELMQQRIVNPEYDEDYVLRQQLGIEQPGAVPNANLGKYYGNVALQDAYTGWRDNRILNTRLAQASHYLKDANKFAYDLDRAQMYDFMNSPMGQARTSLLTQQAMATPRLAKAALKEAVARQQSAANEFGQLGLRRTYFTG